MPIRINLLAEAQAAEDLRRKDPVKRAMWASALLISLMLVWSSSVQLKAMLANRELAKVEGLVNSFTNDFQKVLDNEKKVADVRHRIVSLYQMSTNRFLQASVLNALQVSTVDDVQLVRLRTEQAYFLTDEVKAKTNENGTVSPGRKASVTEKITVNLDGSDSSVNPGDQVPRYTEALAKNTYFHEKLGKSTAISLKNISPPEFSATTGKRSVTFALECRYPERTR